MDIRGVEEIFLNAKLSARLNGLSEKAETANSSSREEVDVATHMCPRGTAQYVLDSRSIRM